MRRAACAVFFAAASLSATQAPRPDLSERALVSKASKYVAEYEKQFAFLIADEAYRQQQFGADGQLVQTRDLKSELFLTYLPADDEWIAVRDVMEVDGTPVPNRPDLRALLSRREELRGLVGKVIAMNARYNIGRIERNFNEPTLPLLLLGAKRVGRVNFDRKEVKRDAGATLVTLAFEERDGAPTLISSRDEGPVRAKGMFLIDAATGTVRRTVFQLGKRGVDVRLETTYTRDPKLDLWLPSLLVERYEAGNKASGRRVYSAPAWITNEVIEGEATYSNYRRFDVTWKIK